MFQSAEQIQQRIESAYFTQQKTYSEHLTTECVPKLEARASALAALVADMPDALKPPLDKYVATLPKMQSGPRELRREAEVARRGQGRRRQRSRRSAARSRPTPTPESVAFEKFLVCAIPDLDKKKDIQGVLRVPGRHLQEGRGHRS